MDDRLLKCAVRVQRFWRTTATRRKFTLVLAALRKANRPMGIKSTMAASRCRHAWATARLRLQSMDALAAEPPAKDDDAPAADNPLQGLSLGAFAVMTRLTKKGRRRQARKKRSAAAKATASLGWGKLRRKASFYGAMAAHHKEARAGGRREGGARSGGSRTACERTGWDGPHPAQAGPRPHAPPVGACGRVRSSLVPPTPAMAARSCLAMQHLLKERDRARVALATHNIITEVDESTDPEQVGHGRTQRRV